MQLPDPISHSLHVLSIEPVRQYSPVKSNCPQESSPECPTKVWMHYPVITSQILAVLSNDEVISLSPSVLKLRLTISA